MDRQEFLRKEIAEYKRRITVYQMMIGEWERELGTSVPAADAGFVNNGSENTSPVHTLAPGADPQTLIRAYEFVNKSQPEAARLFLERFGKPLTTDELLDGLEKGGVKFGGKDRAQKKSNFATILIRAEGIQRVGRGAWALGSKPKKDKTKDSDKEKDSGKDNAPPAASE